MNTRTTLRILRRRTRKLGSVALTGALVAVGTAGCVGGGGDGSTAPPITENTIGLHAFEGCDPLLIYFQEEARASLDAYGELGGPVAVDDAIGAPARGDGEVGGEGPGDPSPQAPGSGNAGGDDGNVDFSGTNVQEVGVDEPDIVKTDGERLYVAQNGYLLVYGADDLAEIGKVQTVGGDAQLLVGGDRAVVLSRLYGAPPEDFPEADADRIARTSKTAIAVYDIGGDGDPVLLRRRYVEGELQAARLAAGTLRVAVHYDAAQYIDWGDVYGGGVSPGEPGVAIPPSEGGGSAGGVGTGGADGSAGAPIDTREDPQVAEDDWRTRLGRMIDESTLIDWVPLAYDAIGDVREVEQPVACGRFHRPGERAGHGVTAVISLDLDTPLADLDDAAVVTGPGVVYASKEGLYLTTTRFPGSFARGGDVTVGVGGVATGGDTEPGAAVDVDAPDDAPSAEPIDSRAQGLQVADDERQATQIHRLDIADGAAGARYVASGRVFGAPLNSFALSEHAGALRIATTETDPETWDTANHLFVLDTTPSDDVLPVTGQVIGLAGGERIYAARFMGDRGFVVTFRQVDPLFTFDLADPTAPAQVGELKVPGFSTYLHPFGDDHLIGIGQDATDEGRVTGMKLSLFDVSDFANPTLAHDHLFGQGWSEALYDHHAFTFWGPESLLVVPIEAWETETPRNGLNLFHVSAADGFSEVGFVDHADLLPDAWATMRRSVVIGDALYSLSTVGIKATGMADLDDRAHCLFPEPVYDHGEGRPEPGVGPRPDAPAPALPSEATPDDEGGAGDGDDRG